MDRRVVAWLEKYCPAEIPRRMRPFEVHPPKESSRRGTLAGLPKFVGGRALLAKYGARLVIEALRDMTTHLDRSEVDEFDFGDGLTLHWRDNIVSPAQYLNWYCRQLTRPADEDDQPQ
jgi:hypothetical protein